MANYRKPEIDIEPATQSLNDGTNVLYRSPAPRIYLKVANNASPSAAKKDIEIPEGDIETWKLPKGGGWGAIIEFAAEFITDKVTGQTNRGKVKTEVACTLNQIKMHLKKNNLLTK